MKECSICFGACVVEEDCPECTSFGDVTHETSCDICMAFVSVEHACPDCDGAGYVTVDCLECGGTGEIEEEEDEDGD